MARGQVTVFIIVGVVILLVAGGFFYLRSQQAAAGREEVRVALEEVPAQLAPIREFMASCVERLAEDGLRRIGDSGGYVSPSRLPSPPDAIDPTEGSAVFFNPGSETAVAYWHYLKSPNDCTGECVFSSARPPLYASDGANSVEEQLASFVRERSSECVSGLQVFADRGFVIGEVGSPSARAIIADQRVFVELVHPIHVQGPDVEATLTQFVAELPVDLQGMYSLASTLAQYESEHRFLEKQARQLIDVFARVDASKLPPVGALTFDLDAGEVWFKSEVERSVSQLLSSYVPILQVFGTRNYRYVEAPAGRDAKRFESLYNRGMLIPLAESHTDVEVSFAYLDWWPPYFDLNCQGELCRSEDVVNTFLFPLGVQRYNFAYDLSYPVIVELRDPVALNGKGFTLRFALESNVRDNKPMSASYEPVRFPTAASVVSLLCDDAQRTVPLTVATGVDAAVSFVCGSESCLLGSSRDGVLDTAAPRCLGGQLVVQAPDHDTVSLALDTSLGEPKRIIVPVPEVRELPVRVRKYALRLLDGEWALDATRPLPLGDDESVFATIRRVVGPGDSPFTAAVEVLGAESGLLRVVPGTFEVKVQSLSYAPLVFSPQERCADTLLSRECFTIPKEPVVFGKERGLPTGGASFVWTVSAAELERASALELGVVVADFAGVPEQQRRIEDLAQGEVAKDVAAAYPDLLRPRVVGR